MDCVFDVDELGAPERRRSNKQRHPGRLGHHHPKTNGQLCCLSRVTRHAGWPEHFGAHFKRCGFTIDARDTDNVGQRRQSHSTEHTHAAIWKHRRFEQVAQHASIVDRCTNPKSGRHLDDVAIDPMKHYPLRCVFLAWVWMATCLPLMSVANERPGVQSQSGNAFLSPSMQAMQNDTMANPISLWLDKGKTLWNGNDRPSSCAQCHGAIETHKTLANQFPKWSSKYKKLINLEDQILECSQRTSKPYQNLEDANVLALSALLHQQSQFQPILLRPQNEHKEEWQKELNAGAQLFIQRIGRMNLACTHCHDQNVGKKMQADIISPGHPTGFPIFKMNWQSMGSIDRRIRACYSGVQAEIPQAGSQDLRQLELFLKLRAEGMTLDGPSMRR